MTTRIQDLPASERPRERFVEKGASALSSAELVAILLGSGTQDRSVLELATALIASFGSLQRLSEATLQELLAVKGIKMAKAVKLMTAFALGRRTQPTEEDRLVIDSPARAFGEISPEIQKESIEVLYILLRDSRKALLHKEAIGKGILNQVLMHPREVFHSAIRHKAHTLIIGHNHPSGDPTPSDSDIKMTITLRSVGQIVGIPVVDHLIIGSGGSYFSFWQKGLLDSRESGY
jgi:DNA repair protein RadC